MFNPCQRYLPSTEETAERFIFRMPPDPQRPVSNELAWTSWVEMITFCTGGRMGKEVENGQSIFLECREEQGQRKLKKASKLIFDLNGKTKPHCAASESIHFFPTELSGCVVLVKQRGETSIHLKYPHFLECEVGLWGALLYFTGTAWYLCLWADRQAPPSVAGAPLFRATSPDFLHSSHMGPWARLLYLASLHPRGM